MSWLSSWLHPGRAYEKGAQVSEDYYQQAQGQMQPYAQQGQEAYGQLSPAIQNMLNPQQLYDQWAQGYQESPYAKQMQEKSMNQGLQAASSMGMLGSTPALRALQEGSSMISNADRENYLNKLLGMYTQGATQAQNIYGQGANMASQMGNQTYQHGGNMAQAAYGQQAAGGNMINELINDAMIAAAMYMNPAMGAGMAMNKANKGSSADTGGFSGMNYGQYGNQGLANVLNI